MKLVSIALPDEAYDRLVAEASARGEPLEVYILERLGLKSASGVDVKLVDLGERPLAKLTEPIVRLVEAYRRVLEALLECRETVHRLREELDECRAEALTADAEELLRSLKSG